MPGGQTRRGPSRIGRTWGGVGGLVWESWGPPWGFCRPAPTFGAGGRGGVSKKGCVAQRLSPQWLRSSWLRGAMVVPRNLERRNGCVARDCVAQSLRNATISAKRQRDHVTLSRCRVVVACSSLRARRCSLSFVVLNLSVGDVW